MKKIILAILVSISVASCKKEEVKSVDLLRHQVLKSPNQTQSRDITIDDAKKAALMFINSGISENSSARNLSSISSSRTKIKSESNPKAIKNVTTFKSQDSISVMFIVNYIPSGFAILSDNKSANPVLAFSDSGEFDVNKIKLNIGLENWMQQGLAYVKERKAKSDSISMLNYLNWDVLLDKNGTTDQNLSSVLSYGTSSSDPRMTAMNQRMGQLVQASNASTTVIPLSAAGSYLPPERLSHFKSIAQSHSSPEQYTIVEIINRDVTTIKGPLMSTHWFQTGVFAANVPNGYAGCTAVAAGQIMNYHRFPTQFNWDNMTNNNIWSFPDIGQFMYTLGQAFDMDYLSTGSAAHYSDVKNGLEDYGYNVLVKDHIPSDVENSINNNRPVYMRGCDGSDCHAWVTEGYRKTNEAKGFRIEWQTSSYTYQSDGVEYYHQGYVFGFGYINWGWGQNFNGWFTSFTHGSSYNFSSSRKNLYISKS